MNIEAASPPPKVPCFAPAALAYEHRGGFAAT
jgi:hypothetical protein